MIELIQTYLIVSIIIYFFPFLLSLLTGNRTGAVFVMNFFLGWTFIGWVWALIWAVTPDRKRDQVIVHNHLPNEKVTVDKEKVIQEPASYEQIDKASLLNQLSQLHSLREKNVISEEIYEQERQTILNKLQPQKQSTKKEFAAETIVQQPPFEPQIIQDEIYDSEYELLFQKKKWYQKPLFWITSTAAILAAVGFSFFKSSHSNYLPEPYANTAIYKLDTVINNIDISGEQYNMKALYEKRQPINISAQDEEDYQAITFLFFKGNKKEPQLIKKISLEQGAYINYYVYKGQNQNLNERGKAYLLVNKSFGGSGSSSEVYSINNQHEHLSIDKIFDCSGELDYIIYNNNDDEILLLKGIWGDNESHFSNHRYTIKKYIYQNGSFTEKILGRTQLKYSSLDEDKPLQQVLTDIKMKEPLLLQTINIKDYSFKNE